MRRFSFLPANENHLVALNEVTVLIGDAAHVLVKMFDENHEDTQPQALHIGTLRAECDKLTKGITRSLSQAIITVLDREDLHSLAVALNDLMRLIATLARDASANTGRHTHQMRQLVELIKQMSAELNRVMPSISRPHEITARVQAIRHLERRGREIYFEGLGDLLREGSSPTTAIVHKDVYTSLAETIVGCRDVGQLVELIAIKNV